MVHGLYYNILIFVFVNTRGSSSHFSMKFFILRTSKSWLLSLWMYFFYLQKPKISETAVQLKQHQLDNSKLPRDRTRGKQPTQGFMPTVSAVGSERTMVVIAWLCSPTQAKKRLVFAFCFFWGRIFFVSFLFCFLWPSMFQLLWLAGF